MAKISSFNNDYVGLSHAEIEENLQMFGKNSNDDLLNTNSKTALLRSALRPIVIMLIICALICLFSKAWSASVLSVIIAVIYWLCNFFINRKISADAQSLHDESVRKVTAVRCGEIVSVPSDMLLPGDVIYLKEGEIVPCDCMVLEEYELAVDEAVLSGVHISIIKTAEQDNSGNKLKSNYIYCGSVVTSGEAVAKVFATGKRTMCSRNDLVAVSAPLRPTDSEKKTSFLVDKIELASIIPFVLCFIILFAVKASGNTYNPAIYSTALASSLIPTLLPLTISLITYFNVKRLCKDDHKVINYYAADDCGDIDIICVDKTGIITANKPKIAEIYTENKQIFAHISTLACDKNNPSTLDNVILEFCEEVGADVPIIQSNYLLHTFPFSSAEKMSAFVWKIDNDTVLAAKGSPEEILRICKLSDADKAVIATKQEEFAKKGYSVIAVAYKDLPYGTPLASAVSKENGLNFAGLYAVNDPPRTSITDAVEHCKANDIKLLIITGDNPDTALSIATNIGIDAGENIVLGDDIENALDEDLSEIIANASVFARISPDTKLKIVECLKKSGKKVCVVGENRDDIGVLQTANVGIAIGSEPCEYAIETSDIWVKNNSLDEITDTIISCKHNKLALKKAFIYGISIQVVMFFTNLLSLISASKNSVLQPAFMPLGILAAQVIMLLLSVTVFANYNDKIHPSRSKIMDIVSYIIRAASIFVVTFLSYKMFLGSAHLDNISTNIEISFGSARCFAFMTFMSIIITSAFNYYSDEYFTIVSFIKSLRKPWVIASTLIAICLVVIICFVPFVSGIFGLNPIGFPSLLLAIALAIIPILVSDLLKAVRK